MIKIKDIGNFETLPAVITDILHNDIPALEKHFSDGWDINQPVPIGEYVAETPLAIAIIMGCQDSLRWLVEQGVNLNDSTNPAFLLAVRYADEKIIRYVYDQGADINQVNNVRSEAFGQALYGDKYENLELIHSLGHTVQKYGGEAFRSSVSKGDFPAIEFFLRHNVDINYNKADMVYPFKPTPLCVAARYVDLDMCKYLVDHGADVTLAEEDGMRPYSIAVERGDSEMAEYFKALEPEDFHNIQNKILELKPYKLSKDLREYLQGNDLHLDLQDNDFEYIDFFSLMQTVPMKIGRKKYLRLSRTTGDYSHIVFLWNPRTRKIAYYDKEHEETEDMASFKDFITSPGEYLGKLF